MKTSFFKSLLYFLFLLFVFGCSDSKTKEEHNTSEREGEFYKELYRPQIHFSPEANWMNDPNGMVYYEGEYHLFYQYYPDSTVWGPMHWAHAVSKDLVRWEHLPIALYPDSLGYIFSGSAVIDKNNTAGFGENAMVAIYTYHDMEGEQSGTSNTYQYQAIAYSTDKGRTFTKYEGNPVIPNPGIKDFRDPKVIWDEGSKQWVMVFAAHDHVKIYGSPNLREWTFLSDWGLEFGEHGGIWECPDLFPIKVADSDETKWVLLQSMNPSAPNGGSGTQYFVGDFDGKSFNLDPSFVDDVSNGKSLWIDYGTDNYAGVTWSNAPVTEDEKLFIGWMSNWQYAQVVPTEKWRSAMTLPRTLKLFLEDGEYRLRSFPIDGLSKLENKVISIEKGAHKSGFDLHPEPLANPFKLELKLSMNTAKSFHLRFQNEKGEYTDVGFNQEAWYFFIDRTSSGETEFEDGFGALHTNKVDKSMEIIDLEIYVDHSSIELFAQDGRVVMTDVVFPSTPYSKVMLTSYKGTVEILEGSISELNSIW